MTENPDFGNEFNVSASERLASDKKDKLHYLLTLENFRNPSSSDISELICILTDSAENEVIQTAVFPVLKIIGTDAIEPLLNRWNTLNANSGTNEADLFGLTRLSYALSQISETPTFVFEQFLLSPFPQIRRSGLIGISNKTNADRQFDAFLFHIIQTDSDPETAFEAAATLASGDDAVLPLFEQLLSVSLTRDGIITNEGINEDGTENFLNHKNQNSNMNPHVLGKIIEISGNLGNFETIRLIKPYLSHPDPHISNPAAEAIQKIKSGKL